MYRGQDGAPLWDSVLLGHARERGGGAASSLGQHLTAGGVSSPRRRGGHGKEARSRHNGWRDRSTPPLRKRPPTRHRARSAEDHHAAECGTQANGLHTTTVLTKKKNKRTHHHRRRTHALESNGRPDARGVPTSSQRTARRVCERAAKSASAPSRADLWDRKRNLPLARGLTSTQREGRRPLPRTGEQGTEVHSPDTGGAGHSRRDPTSKAMPKAGPRRGWR